ncbi:unnamed protein product [Sphenostylis stenocarpa]|uniref:SAWADEE domain-containing protein n=1 Tax=Sphenostylis stenocarpa TaxID=92480 RepID=A0AA86W4T2_9FABA|nr:unnamed protein product [Sphenostylis stenocarpa]
MNVTVKATVASKSSRGTWTMMSQLKVNSKWQHRKRHRLGLMENENGYKMEFRAYTDEAWYTVRVSVEGETLRVKFLDFPDENDNAFEASQFGECKYLHDFQGRFRPLSKQAQDSECRTLEKGTRVCACQRSGKDDLSYYDALVDGVSLHSRILRWPNAGNLTVTTIEDICIVQPEGELDPVLASFLEMARGKVDLFSSCSVSASKEVSCMEMVPDWNRSSNTTFGIGYFERIEKAKFQEMCGFLNNPSCIITSSSGRPWVIHEKLVGLKKIEASIGTLMHISKSISQKGKNGASNNLKVVHSGTQEFKIASDLRDLFLEFTNHQKRLHKRLALEEGRVFKADEQLA